MLPAIASATGDVTWVSGTDVFDATLPLTLSLEELNTGTQVFMMVTAEDFGGDSAFVFGEGIL